MASLSYTPTEEKLKTMNLPTDAAAGRSHICKKWAKGTLSASAVVIDLRACTGIPMVTFASGVTMYVSTDPILAFDSAARDWTAVSAGDGFADCPAFIAFEGTGAYEIYIAG
jgi:hypothetical protein